MYSKRKCDHEQEAETNNDDTRQTIRMSAKSGLSISMSAAALVTISSAIRHLDGGQNLKSSAMTPWPSPE